jgi:hypothetical protein
LQAANLLKPITLAAPPANAEAIVKAAMEKAGVAARGSVDAYMAKHGIEGRYCGWANAVTWDVTEPIVQYLLKAGCASGPFDGRVHIDFPQDYPPSQSLDYNEAGVNAACVVLSAELGIDVYCHSHAD